MPTSFQGKTKNFMKQCLKKFSRRDREKVLTFQTEINQFTVERFFFGRYGAIID